MEKPLFKTLTAYLGLGANLGERRSQLQGARAALGASDGVRVTAASPLYETEPVGGPAGQPSYLNAVLQVETTLDCRDLLSLCLAVEARFGRRREEPWGPRTLDIDLLLCGAEVIDEPGLVVPHPRLHQRRFVLAPLAVLAPQLRHPVLGLTVCDLLAGLEDESAVTLHTQEW